MSGRRLCGTKLPFCGIERQAASQFASEIIESKKSPVTQKLYHGLITDSGRWAHYVPRAGDVVVSTPPKSGTTWMQAILALLISGDPNVDANPSERSPWFDNKLNDVDEIIARLDGQTGRRHVKTHTPMDGIPIWDEVRYISVYRHPIDVHFSSRKHVANYRAEMAEFLGVNETTYPRNPRDSFRLFIEGENLDHGSLKTVVGHYLRSLEMEPRENFLRLHYADMTRDLAGHVAKVATHVGEPHPPEVMERLVEAATFASMKANTDRFVLAAGKEFWRSDSGFFDSATSNKWEGKLTDDDLAAYDSAITEYLSPEQRYWLEWGTP